MLYFYNYFNLYFRLLNILPSNPDKKWCFSAYLNNNATISFTISFINYGTSTYVICHEYFPEHVRREIHQKAPITLEIKICKNPACISILWNWWKLKLYLTSRLMKLKCFVSTSNPTFYNRCTSEIQSIFEHYYENDIIIQSPEYWSSHRVGLNGLLYKQKD